MAGKSITGEFTLAAAIRRYFDVVLYLLIFTGFGTLASTGSLDFPTVLIVSGALLFRGYILARRGGWPSLSQIESPRVRLPRPSRFSKGGVYKRVRYGSRGKRKRGLWKILVKPLSHPDFS